LINRKLAESYLGRAKTRLKALELFLSEEDFPDVVREAQEVVELCQKALLIERGIQPPKWHEVGDILEGYFHLFPEDYHQRLRELNREAKWLRAQREIAFYGAMDFVPEEVYTREDAERALSLARAFVGLAEDLRRKVRS